jgi:hypothetical protein
MLHKNATCEANSKACMSGAQNIIHGFVSKRSRLIISLQWYVEIIIHGFGYLK